MRCTRRFKDGARLYVCLVGVAAGAAWSAACTSDAAGSGDTSIVVQVLQDDVSIENQTGTSLSKGEVTLIASGIPRPYTINLPYMTNGLKRTFPLNSFRMSDGSPFRRDLANGKSIKVEARDVTGKIYMREVPFR